MRRPDRAGSPTRCGSSGTAPPRSLIKIWRRSRRYEVSTPQTRRAAINDLRRLETVAALRRRRVLLVLMAVLSAVIGVCAVELIPWWSVAIPGGLLVIFVVVCPDQRAVHAPRASTPAISEIAHGSDEIDDLPEPSRKPAGAAGQEVRVGDQGRRPRASRSRACSGTRCRSPCRPTCPSRWRRVPSAPSTCPDRRVGSPPTDRRRRSPPTRREPDDRPESRAERSTGDGKSRGRLRRERW